MSEDNQTMRDLYEEHGHDTDALVHPKNVSAEALDDGSTVVAYTVVQNHDPDAPATTYDIVEWEIKAVVAADDLEAYSDGVVSYPDDSPVTHGVHWADRTGGVPKVQSIDYGNQMYGDDSDFDDPQRWDRLVANVRARSDDFIRFRV